MTVLRERPSESAPPANAATTGPLGHPGRGCRCSDPSQHGNNPRCLGDYRNVECEVAREALSARIDGEREPVPSLRVDEHLGECPECRSWFERVSAQAARLRRLVGPPMTVVRPRSSAMVASWVQRLSWQRWALLVIGVLQIVLGAVQGLGLGVGLEHAHGMGSDAHLLNESTAWSTALGVVMVGAAIRPGAAAGLAGVLAAFTFVLTAYVAADAAMGSVTMTRILTHIPVVVGAVIASLVWRSSIPRKPGPPVSDEPEIVLPRNAARGRRRGHLWPTDGSAA